MIKLTKVFHFEMAHAIHGYSGLCKNIHGHSYELHVTVSSVNFETAYIPAPGFLIDFKEIKLLVNESILKLFDHHIILSEAFLMANPSFSSLENLIIFEEEPTAENLLINIKLILNTKFPKNIILKQLKLFETNDSYAEWTNN